MAAPSVHLNARAETQSHAIDDPDREARTAAEAHTAERARRVMCHELEFTEEFITYPNDGEQPAFAREFWEGRMGLDKPFEAEYDAILTRGDFKRSSALFAGDVGGMGERGVSITLAFRPVCVPHLDNHAVTTMTPLQSSRIMILDATGTRPANLHEMITQHAYKWYRKIAHGKVVGTESHVEVTVAFGTLRAARITGRLTKHAFA